MSFVKFSPDICFVISKKYRIERLLQSANLRTAGIFCDHWRGVEKPHDRTIFNPIKHS